MRFTAMPRSFPRSAHLLRASGRLDASRTSAYLYRVPVVAIAIGAALVVTGVAMAQ
jgi:hypothetical protein